MLATTRGVVEDSPLNAMDEAARRQLLKDEYLHLQKVIEDFDGRAVTIKAWSVTFSLVAVVGAFASHAPPALLIASFSALLFWLIEGYWKTFQYAYCARADRIERAFAGESGELVPLQIGASWSAEWKAGGRRRLVKVMLWPHVALPHAAVLAVGVALYVLRACDLLRL